MTSPRVLRSPAVLLARGGLCASLAYASAPAAGCGGREVFQCQSDRQCGGEDGVCERSGYCSFADEECPSGRRYASKAVDGLAGQCVEPEAGEGDDGAATSEGSEDPRGDSGEPNGEQGSSGTESGSGSGSLEEACGDGIIDPEEECDDAGPSEFCDADCTVATCGDGVVNAAAGEECDDANDESDDACVECVSARCGDGFLWTGVEECDDGNTIDADACTNDCARGTIVLAGTGREFLDGALTSLAEPFQTSFASFPDPGAGGVLIMGHNGTDGAFADYVPFIEAGGHVLVVGGAANEPYTQWASDHVEGVVWQGWHRTEGCSGDFVREVDHPITALLPASYQFSIQASGEHMLHFAQPEADSATIVLATSCEAGPDNGVMITRRHPSGGTWTHLAPVVGSIADESTVVEFLEPLLAGYLSYVRAPVRD